MKSDEKELKSRRRAAIIAGVAIVIFIAIDIGLYFLEGVTGEWIGCLIISAILIVLTSMAIVSYRRLLRVRNSEDTDDTSRSVTATIPGRDMFDVCRKFYIRQQRTVWIVLFVCIVLASVAITAKSYQTFDNLSWWIIFPITAGVALLMVIFGRSAFKEDMSFKKPEDMRLAIAKRGEDKIRVNADFMSGSIFGLFKGIMVIGMSYCVVYAKKQCAVIILSEVTRVELCVHTIKRSGSNPTIVRYWLTFTENGTDTSVLCGSEVEAEHIIDELRRRGIDVSRREA